MVVDRYRELALREMLTDDVLVEEGLDLRRGWNLLVPPRDGLCLRVLSNDVQAKLDAFRADVHIRARNNLVDLSLRLVAEGAGESGGV